MKHGTFTICVSAVSLVYLLVIWQRSSNDSGGTTAEAGFVHIPEPEALGLKPNQGVVQEQENVYMISGMHQLHCLKELQTSLISGGDVANDTAGLHHALHCLNYLRQGVLCAADRTLEGPDENPQLGESPLRGWGVTHTCNSWDALIKYRDKHSIRRGTVSR